MSLAEKHIFTVVIPGTSEHPEPWRCKVLLWQSYGVVCPDILTANGSFRDTSEWIFSAISRGKYRYSIEDSRLPRDAFSSEEALCMAMRQAYLEFRQELGEI